MPLLTAELVVGCGFLYMMARVIDARRGGHLFLMVLPLLVVGGSMAILPGAFMLLLVGSFLLVYEGVRAAK